MINVKETLGDIKDHCKPILAIQRIYRKGSYERKSIKIENAAHQRAEGLMDLRYQPIREFKNLHEGKRCFIIATGPSLQIKDIEALSGEITFGMNSICKLFPQTNWRPTYYGIQDTLVYQKMEKDILNSFSEHDYVFVSDFLADRFSVPETYIQFPYNHFYHQYGAETHDYFAKFSDDSYVMVYDGYSITYSLIQVAVYMGFKEIYLLGADCSYQKGQKNHVVESGYVDRKAEDNHDKMIVGYQKAKEYADSHGIKIINCTRGGMLEVYPRMSLEDVLKQR